MSAIHPFQLNPPFTPHQKRPAEKPEEEPAAKRARIANLEKIEALQYEKKINEWNLRQNYSETNPQGSYKVACETALPGTIALVTSVFKRQNRAFYGKLAEDEISLIRSLGTVSHVPRLFDAFSIKNTEYTMIQEHMGPNLFTLFLNRNNPARGNLTLSEIENISKKLLESLRDLHARRIVHGDIKPDNCTETALIDFNLSGILNAEGYIRGGRYSDRYRPPENIFEKISHPASDMWAFGATLYELAIGTPFMHVARVDKQQYKINALHTFSQRLQIGYDPRNIPPECLENGMLKPSTNPDCFPLEEKLNILRDIPKGTLFADLVMKLLRFYPEDRITAAEALRHPFFTLQPQDRSFHLQVQGDERLHLKILNYERQVVEVFNLPNCPPDACLHIRPSTAPYCVELAHPETSETVLHSCNFPLFKDHLVVSVNTNTKEISVREPIATPMALSGPAPMMTNLAN